MLLELILLLNLILGIVFGFIHRGKEDYTGLLRNGAIAGLLLAKQKPLSVGGPGLVGAGPDFRAAM